MKSYAILSIKEKGEKVMYISYAKLWKLLLDKGMKKTDLIDLCGISSRTLSKLSKNENVNTDTLLSICRALNCDLSEIMETCREESAKTIYEEFCRQKNVETDEYCKTYRFMFRGKTVVLKKSVQRANKHTVIQCKGTSVQWEQIRPLGIAPVRELSFLCDTSFWEKDTVCIVVISGNPMGFQNLDEGIFVSHGREFDPCKPQIYVMSEARFKLFEPIF